MTALTQNELPLAQSIATGRIHGVGFVNKFGRNADVDAATAPEDIWGGGGIYTGFPVEIETVEVFSASIEDGAGTATGMLTMVVIGLDENGIEQTAEVTLNGTTPVLIPTLLWSRLNRAYGVEAGSVGINVGNITIRHTTTTANIFAVLPAGYGQTEIACWTCPSDKNAIVMAREFVATSTAAAVKEAELAFALRRSGTTCWRIINPSWTATSGEGAHEDLSAGGLHLFPGDDVTVRCNQANADNLIMTAEWDMYVFDPIPLVT